jgi:hypothetical protein
MLTDIALSKFTSSTDALLAALVELSLKAVDVRDLAHKKCTYNAGEDDTYAARCYLPCRNAPITANQLPPLWQSRVTRADFGGAPAQRFRPPSKLPRRLLAAPCLSCRLAAGHPASQERVSIAGNDWQHSYLPCP